MDENRDYAQVLEEITNGAITTAYSYGHDLISQDKNGATSFYHYDGLGSTRALSDAAGTLTDSYDYEAFGELLNQTGDTENRYLFTGEQFDSGLNQYYLRARYYNQAIGRFTQMDSWMGNNHDPITLHKYAYGNADPVTYTDPTGNFGLGSFGVGFSVQGVLTTASIASSAINFYSAATDEDGLTAKEVGFSILLAASGPAGGKLINLLAKKHKDKILKIPGRVRTRVNLAKCVTRNSAGKCTEGFEHIEDIHFNPAKASSRSQFTIDKEELRYLLQSPQVVGTLPKEIADPNKVRYLRIVKLSKEIGKDAKSGNRPTKYLPVFTDKAGNILTAFPGKLQ